MRIGRSEVCATTNSAEKKRISGSGFPCRPLQTVIHYVFGLFFYVYTLFFPTRVSVAQGTQGLDASINAQYDIRSYTALYNVILNIARNFHETRENIKISTHSFYTGGQNVWVDRPFY